MGKELSHRLNLVVPGTVDYLDEIREFVASHARGAGFSSDDAIDEVVLSLDEAVANVVEHAYEESPLPIEDQTLNIVVEKDEETFRITLIDQGSPYDPTQAPEIDLDDQNESGNPDGRGIFIMRRLMDEMKYRYREGEGNILEMVKYIDKK